MMYFAKEVKFEVLEGIRQGKNTAEDGIYNTEVIAAKVFKKGTSVTVGNVYH